MPTPTICSRPIPASSIAALTMLAAASSPSTARWSTSISRQCSASTVCERSATATAMWLWPKSMPMAAPALGQGDPDRRAADLRGLGRVVYTLNDQAGSLKVAHETRNGRARQPGDPGDLGLAWPPCGR